MQSKPTPKLTTSREAYHRVRWDPRFDGRRFVIGYDTRELGMQEMPLLDYEPGGDIPWHRIWYIRRDSQIVWDRRARLDRLDDAWL